MMDMAKAAARRIEKTPAPTGKPGKLPQECLKPMQDLFGMLWAQSLMRDLMRWTQEDDDDMGYCCGYYGHDSDLAEKMVGSFGKKAVDPGAVADKISECIKKWGNDPSKAEEDVLGAIQSLHAQVRDKSTSLGLDNLLRKMADKHENAMYRSERKG